MFKNNRISISRPYYGTIRPNLFNLFEALIFMWYRKKPASFEYLYISTFETQKKFYFSNNKFHLFNSLWFLSPIFLKKRNIYVFISFNKTWLKISFSSAYYFG